MRVEFVSDDDRVWFELHDVSRALDATLGQAYWQRDGDVWRRPYPATAPHLDLITTHFRAHAEEMVEQMAYVRPTPWADALDAFARRADAAGLRWWLTGSVAACVRGVPLRPHDVDIMIDHDQVEPLTEAFADVIIEPLVDTAGWVTRDFGVLFLHARVDIASDPSPVLDDPEPVDCGPYARAHLEVVSFRGREILVPPLELQVAANRRRGRVDRVEALERHLAEAR